MKNLRNKETGIIGELHFEPDKEYHFTVVTEDPADMMIYKKLADLYAGWEDYEDPDLTFGNIFMEGTRVCIDFKSVEAGGKAMEKLEAWKRLEDKGFRFNRWTIPEEPKTPHIKLVIEAEMDVPDSPYDLNLLFGGEK